MRLLEIPDGSVDPTLGITGRTDKVVLQTHFGHSAIARLPQPMPALEFTNCGLDGEPAPAQRRGFLSRSDKLPALGLRPGQDFSRDISPIDILHRGWP